MIHVHTQKGKGYAPAEKNPSKFHGIGHFDRTTGEPIRTNVKTFSQQFGETMVQLATENPNLCAVTAAMPEGTGLMDFMKAYPSRTFDVGIAEEHAVSMAGGLAKQGMIPVVAIYSTFLQRSFDQIIQDVAMQNLHVVFAVDRAGLVGEDGETHHGVFDVGYLRLIPGITVLCPASLQELNDMLCWAVSEHKGPVVIRYPRGGNRKLTDSAWGNQPAVASESRLVLQKPGTDAWIVTYGVITDNALRAAEGMEKNGFSVGVIRLLTIEPISSADLANIIGGCNTVFILEECSSDCGIFETISQQMHVLNPDCRISGIHLPKGFARHGNLKTLYEHYGLDGASIEKRIMEVLQVEK